MWKDPIVEEIHKIREKHAAKFHYDLRAIVKYYQNQQKRSTHKATSFVEQKNKVFSKAL